VSRVSVRTCALVCAGAILVFTACGGDQAAAPPPASSNLDAAIDTGAIEDASVGVDAGSDALPPHIDPGIACAQADCNPGAHEVCCRRGTQEPYEYACSSAPCAMNALTIPCDDDSDCAALGQSGTVCCMDYSQASFIVTAVSCRAASECTLAQSRAPVCDPTAPAPCPVDAGTCKPSMGTLLGYHICL
jgi:hypothetical protein